MNKLSALIRELKIALAYAERSRERACDMQETALAQRLREIIRELNAEIISLEAQRDNLKEN